MTKAEAYLDRLYNEWQVWEEKLKALPDDYNLLYRKYSRVVQSASAKYHAAKYMMELMKEEEEND